MKRMYKIGAVLALVLLFFIVNMRVKAVDLGETYQTATENAWQAYQRAKEAATGMYQTAKDTATSVKDTISGAVSSGVQWMAGDDLTAVRLNPYKDTVALVRIGNELNTNERVYLEKRQPKVKVAFEKMLGRSLDVKYVPTLAIVASGGGYRAMLGTLGSFSAIEKLGIMDATTYISALSGSTWALSSWLSTGMMFSLFKNYIQNTIQKDIHISSIGEAKNIIDMLSVKLAFDEPVTTVDIYGGLLANRLLNIFGSDCQRVYLSQQAERLKDADIPFPIYTAIDARQAVAREPHWYEYTPYEIGSSYFGVYVPTWAYGRQFYNGQSINFAPEQSLGFMMGTWGSAFGVHFGRVWDEINAQLPSAIVPYIERKLVDPLTGKRISTSWAEIFNFMYGIPGQELTARPTIKFVDAGIDFNLPYPPVSGERPERKADIMIFLDFSGGSLVSGMKKTEEYARRKGLKFPQIDYTALATKAMSIFKDPADPSVPVVIYFPRISDAQLWMNNASNPAFSNYGSIGDFDFEQCTNAFSGPCGTTNFQYSLQNSQKLMDQMEFNIMAHKDQIMEAINWVIDQNSQ